jgi:hypothetical protein
MNAITQVLCSLALTFGVPVMVAGWELWHLGSINRRPPPGDDIAPEPTPLPDAGASPPIRSTLPDCLIPRAAPARVRELA